MNKKRILKINLSSKKKFGWSNRCNNAFGCTYACISSGGQYKQN